MSKQFIITIITLILLGVLAGAGVLLAKGYRLSSKGGTIAGTGILSVNSIPDQASVYLDDHLTTASNANINSLVPKAYQVKIVKEGFITWEKQVEVKEGLVSEVKATLFRAIPTVYPLTYTGVGQLVLSSDGQKLVYAVPGSDKKSGVWVWQLSDRPIAFARGSEKIQVAQPQSGIDYTKAKFRWSPDSNQLLVTLSDRYLLLEINRLNDPPRDITAIIQPTIKAWDEDQKVRDMAKLEVIQDLSVRKIASGAAVLKWSPDETRILYCTQNCADPKEKQGGLKVVDLGLNKSFDLPRADYYHWLPDSKHLILVENLEKNLKANEQPGLVPVFPRVKISVVEADGFNQAEIYVGNLDPQSVFPWPDGSRLVVISSLPTATASQPNLYGINLK